MSGTVTINEKPDVTSYGTVNPSTCTPGNDGTITLNGLDPNTTYSVTFNYQGNPVSAADYTTDGSGTLTITNLSAGIYDGIIATLSSTGCASDAVPGPHSEITLYSPPTPTPYDVTGGTNCGVSDVGLDGSDTGILYQLMNGLIPVGSPYVGDGNPVDFGNQYVSGTYTVIATNSITNCTSNMNGSSVVNPLPAPTITSTSSNLLCAVSTGNVYTTEPGMTNYIWTTSAGGTITAGAGTNSVTVTWNLSGNQTIKVNYTNTFGCTAITPAVYNVTVNAPANIDFPPVDANIAQGNNTSLSVSTTGTGLTYQWQVSSDGGSTFNNITSAGSNPAYSGFNSATLILTYVVIGNNGHKYQCVVTRSSPCSTTPIVSSSATLNVHTPGKLRDYGLVVQLLALLQTLQTGMLETTGMTAWYHYRLPMLLFLTLLLISR